MLENMGYWQNGLEMEKNGMLPYGNAALIRVKQMTSSKFVHWPPILVDNSFTTLFHHTSSVTRVFSLQTTLSEKVQNFVFKAHERILKRKKRKHVVKQ